MTRLELYAVETRVTPQTLAGRWPDEKRRLFLLNEDVARPLSVDTDIWPRSELDETQTVRVAILTSPAIPGRSEIIEAGVEAWRVLGYDVADAYQVSGLVNCGYALEAKSALKEVWAPRLTADGLIASAEWAEEFVSIANRRVAEHAPFFVYELRSAQ